MKKRFQKPLDDSRDAFSGLTEYEEYFLPNPSAGPYESEKFYDEVLDLEFFTSKEVQKSRDQFDRRARKNIFFNDLLKIEEGLCDYAKSSTKSTKAYAILLKSILALEPDYLNKKYKFVKHELQYSIPESYFNKYDWLNLYSIDDSDLISPSSLKAYIKHSNIVLKNAFKRWKTFLKNKYKKSISVQGMGNILVYRGINNRDYYNRKKTDNTDIVSIYSGANETMPFFEKSLLTSYSVSQDIALKFVVGSKKKKSQRKTFIYGDDTVILGRVFASFLTCNCFNVSQYEILCLPDVNGINVNVVQNSTFITHLLLQTS
ncbi:hypothetical protein [Tellurirhabdus rosea]|uniref:hypothetical protein n=1 Tax=Tellurirhabdus rosea TaxID=2674997 RepID=UPI002253E3F6|nr:hypothetical protein [Tellurirhabdus rosea]